MCIHWAVDAGSGQVEEFVNRFVYIAKYRGDFRREKNSSTENIFTSFSSIGLIRMYAFFSTPLIMCVMMSMTAMNLSGALEPAP